MDGRERIGNWLYQPLYCKAMTKKILEILKSSDSNEDAALAITSHVLEYTEWLQICCETCATDDYENEGDIALWSVHQIYLPNPDSNECVIETNNRIYEYWIKNVKK